MKMKKGLLTMLALLSMGSSAFAQTEGTVNVPTVKRTAGQVKEVSVVKNRQAKVKIELTNFTNYRDLQFDLTLPGGITVVSEVVGENEVIQVETAKTSHKVAANAVASNKVRFVVYNEGNVEGDNVIKLGDGIIVEIPVNVAEGFSGSQTATLDNILTSNDAAIESIEIGDGTFDFRALLLGDVNDDTYVDATDAVAIALHDLKATPAIFVEEVGDVVEDGLVDSTDAVRIALDDLAKTPSSSKAYVEEENETEVEPE